MNFFSAAGHSQLSLLTFYLILLPFLNAELDDQLVNYILKQYPNIEVMIQIPSHCRGLGSYLCICNNGDPECNQQSTSGCYEYDCLNGGICKNYACDCSSGYSGQRCEIRDEQEIKRPISQVYVYPNKKLLLGQLPMTDNSEFNPIAIPYPLNPVGSQYPVIPAANQNPPNPVLPYPQGFPYPQNPAVVPYPSPGAVLPAVDTSKILNVGQKLITAKKTGAKNYLHKIIALIISIFVLAGIGTAAVLYFFKKKWFLVNKPRFQFPPEMTGDESYKYVKPFEKRQPTPRQKLLADEELNIGSIYAQPSKITPNEATPQ